MRPLVLITIKNHVRTLFLISLNMRQSVGFSLQKRQFVRTFASVSIAQIAVHLDQHVLALIKTLNRMDGGKDVFGGRAVQNTPREGHAGIRTVVMPISREMNSTVLSEMAERIQTG
jgi:hypothetical protein